MPQAFARSRNLPNTRIDVADALRGIAVAGIILYHSVEHFNIFTQEPIVHTLASDQTVADVLAWLLSGKMYGIFAMLFGLSFFIMNDNQQQKGRNYRAYKNRMVSEPLGDVDGFTPDQRFYLAYARVWACNSTPEYIAMLVNSDVHSPARLRVMAALPMIDTWYEAFGIQPTDKMFIPKEKRALVW